MSDDPTLFRRAAPLETVAQETSPGAGFVDDFFAVPSAVPPSLYLEEAHVPYVVDILGARSLYETFSLKGHAKQVNDGILEEMRAAGLPDDQESYRSVVERYLEDLRIRPGSDCYLILEKLARYFRIQRKARDSASENESLLNADPFGLSPEKFRKYMELKHPSSLSFHV